MGHLLPPQWWRQRGQKTVGLHSWADRTCSQLNVWREVVNGQRADGSRFLICALGGGRGHTMGKRGGRRES